MATPRKEKPAETPGYWPTTKMAELFELTARRIQQLTQDGVLKTHDTPAGRRYNVGEATKDYIKWALVFQTYQCLRLVALLKA